MDFLPIIEKIASKIVLKSAINPLLWLCAIISLPSVIMAVFVSDPYTKTLLFIFAGIPLLATLAAFAYFMFTKPAFLRSERFHLQHDAMSLLGDQGSGLNATAKDICDITNPALPSSIDPGQNTV